MTVAQDLLDVPFPEMVSKLAVAIAQSQFKLDMACIEIAKIMGDKKVAPVYLPNIKLDASGTLASDENNEIVTSMIGAGFQPTFYQFTDTIIEIKMAIKMQLDTSYERKTSGTQTTVSGRWWSGGSNYVVTSTPVDAKYASKYSYQVEGSSLLRTKITPVPPNQFMQKLLDMKATAIRMEFELEMKKQELLIEAQKKKTDDAVKAEESKPT